jgi:DNA repair protein RecN (Recombination protein N)
MLNYLSIRDFILVERLDLSFNGGFSVLTGETGAGKSIIADALLFLLGGRAKTDVIRTDSDKASVQGTFQIGSKGLLKFLSENGIEPENGELIIKREISRDGRSRAFTNGQQIPVSVLKSLGDLIADFHGQHDHQSLMKREVHLELLDEFGGITDSVERYGRLFENWRVARERLEAVVVRNAELKEKETLLEHRRKELSEANLKDGSENAILAKIKRIEGGAKMAGYIDNLRDVLGTEALGALRRAEKLLVKLSEMDSQYESRISNITEAIASAESALVHLPDFSEDDNEESLDELNEALAKIAKLKRKYQKSETELLQLLIETEAAISFLGTSNEDIEALGKEAEMVGEAVLNEAEKISASRKKIAAMFEKEVLKNLKELNMGNSRFSVSFEKRELPAVNGIDSVEFLFSANAGEKVKPLSKTASGGELARVMLSIRVVIAEKDGVPVLVFDEVDTGIGGETADKVGLMLGELGKKRQVFCVTHSHQIAKEAASHYSVEKISSGGRTIVRVRELDKDDRVDELARMLGGTRKKAAVEHARILLK